MAATKLTTTKAVISRLIPADLQLLDGRVGRSGIRDPPYMWLPPVPPPVSDPPPPPPEPPCDAVPAWVEGPVMDDPFPHELSTSTAKARTAACQIMGVPPAPGVSTRAGLCSSSGPHWGRSVPNSPCLSSAIPAVKKRRSESPWLSTGHPQEPRHGALRDSPGVHQMSIRPSGLTGQIGHQV